MGVFISLIIPVYNVEKYVTQCLDSVVDQIVPFDEVIIVNDGSSDHSLEICEKYVSKCEYLRLISQENRGLSSARNIGISEASGEYIMFLDSDDYFKLDAVKILKEKLRKTRCDAIFFDAEIFFDETMTANKKNIYDRSLAGLDGKVMSGEEYFSKCYPEKYIVSACMAVYKTQLIKGKRISFPEGLYYEDNYFSFVLLENAKQVIHISEKLYYRRYRTGSITLGGYSEKKLSDHIQIGLLIWEEILKRKNMLSSMKEELLLKYVSDYYCIVLDKYQYCKLSHIPLSQNVKADLKSMAERYSLLLKILHLEKVNTNLTLFNQVLTDIYYTNLYLEENLDKETWIIQNVVRKQKCIYYSLLKNIPLNISGVKIGIYGTGNHTKGLLTIYERLFGKIICDLFFLDSYKNKGCVWGRNLINYKDIDTSTDLIVLSSFLYEKEMLENIKSVMNEIPIYRFYSDIKGDVFSGYEAFLQYW